MERNVDCRALLMAAAVQRGAVGSTVASKIDGYLADCEAWTGFNAGLLAVVAVACIALGAAAVVVRARRR